MAKNDSRRRLLLAATALLLCAAAVFLLLWLNPNRVYTYQAQTASAAQAADTCPFALITRQEFQLAAELLANENVTAFYPNPGQVDPPAHELPVGLVDAEALRIGGQRARVMILSFTLNNLLRWQGKASLSVFGLMICVDYSTPVPDDRTPCSRCILAISHDGTITKTSSLYENGEAVYTVENTDNTDFIISRVSRNLLYFLHGN